MCVVMLLPIRSTSQPRNTLSSEYMALVLKEWEMADREATGFLTMDEFVRFHYRMCLLHKIPSWKMDPYLLRYIKRQFPEGRVSFREFCLYAEDGEVSVSINTCRVYLKCSNLRVSSVACCQSYVDNVKEITKRLVERYSAQYSNNPLRPWHGFTYRAYNIHTHTHADYICILYIY